MVQRKYNQTAAQKSSEELAINMIDQLVASVNSLGAGLSSLATSYNALLTRLDAQSVGDAGFHAALVNSAAAADVTASHIANNASSQIIERAISNQI